MLTSGTGSRGFTLLEVALATALLGIALTALIEGFSYGVGLLTVLAEREALGAAAASRAALLAAGAEPGAAGSGNDPTLRWRWFPPSESATGEPGRVTVSRTRWRGGRETVFTLHTWAGARR